MAEHDQRGVRKILALHAPKLAQSRADRKPRPVDKILLNLLPVSGVLFGDCNQTKPVQLIK
jgi:hypothetical protein